MTQRSSPGCGKQRLRGPKGPLQPCVARPVSGATQALAGAAQPACNKLARSIAPTTHREVIDMDRDTNSTTGANREPAEGRPDLGIPGADTPDELPGREEELPERLSERIYGGSGQGVATGEPDLKPDVEIPEETM
jgi:hypothetical protein